MNHVTKTNPAALKYVSAMAFARLMRPDGKCRCAVRGFNASSRRSTMRLNPIAVVRAQTIAARISRNVRHPGHPRSVLAATTIDANANGSANTVCEKRTNSKYFRIWNTHFF